jgi:chromate transporter
MIVAFVGFLGGWSSQTLGLSPLAAGVAGALVATVFTFLPSFLFILAGGPLVERTRNDLRVGAPLAGISCAVVGVMASMALYFAQEVLFPKPSGAFDPVAALIAIACTVALVRYKVGVVKVIAVCAGLGLILRLAGWH